MCEGLFVNLKEGFTIANVLNNFTLSLQATGRSLTISKDCFVALLLAMTLHLIRLY